MFSEMGFLTRLAREAIAKSGGLLPLTRGQNLFLLVAALAAVAGWHVYFYGWNGLLEWAHIKKTLGVLAVGIIFELGDFLAFQTPYEPRNPYPNDMPRL